MRIRKTIIAKITETLNKVDSLKAVLPYPATKITTYPTAIFYEDSFENSFESNKDNFKILKFKMWVVVGTAQKERTDIFSDVLPNVVDDIISQFDEDWDGGTIDGHRVWSIINSGTWSMSVVQNGLEAVAELDLFIKLITNN